MSSFRPAAFGWQRDLPDPRDYGPAHANVLAAFQSVKRATVSSAKKLDLSEYFPQVEDDDQLEVRACSACAVAALAGYFERRSAGGPARGSRLFLYQTALRASERVGDCDIGLRATIRALARFGLPPERLWPYEPARVTVAPEPFLYSFGREYQSLVYIRLEPTGATGKEVLQSVKAHLVAGFPSVLGFPAFESLTRDLDVAFPTRFDAVLGGAAAVAVGYDDTRRIRSTKGAFRVRMSWGPDWGEGGYGWLPYAYVEERLAVDFWTLLRPDWLASGEFLRPAHV